MKKWELVQWERRCFAVGLELVRDNLNVLIEAWTPGEVRWYMERLDGWENKESRMRFYDVHRMTRTEWDGRR